MGSSCSSGQAHKDKDSVSTRSEESPSYQVTCKKPSQGSLGNHSITGQRSGVILEASTVAATVQQNLRQNNGTSGQPGGGETERRPLATKAVRNIATSSASADSMSLSSPPGTSGPSPRGDWGQFPPPVRQLGENTHNLLMGRVAASRTGARSSKIVLYVCAADSQDCCCEKRVLHTVVYPELRALCRRHGYELHIVDLHWKTGLEKQQDHEFPELCLGELARQMSVSYVVPVLFLSNSLGTPLLPNTVETQDFEMALKNAEDKELLQKWYSLDSHAQPPCYRLQPISKHIPGFKENCLEEKERALTEWRTEIERTLAVMVEVFPQELRDTYLTTVVEQEVHNTVCMSQELARRCLWVYRVYTQTGQLEASGQTPTAEAELKRRLDNLHRDLKNQLTEKHILRVPVTWSGGVINPDLPEHAQYLTTITQQLTTQLSAIVEGIIEDHNKLVPKPSYGIDSRLFEELTAQTSFCQRAAQCSINREDVLLQIKTYLSDGARNVLVIQGPRGCGKSTLLARAAQCCHSWLPDSALLLRFVNVTSNSTTTAQVLASLANQCSVLSTGEQVWATHNVSTYAELLPRLLTAASLQRPQIVMIDGIDQIREYDAGDLEWLFTELPENVKVIVSIADDSPMFQAHGEQISAGRQMIQMPLLGKTEADAILMASVMQYNHSVNSRVQHCVRASVQDCTLPLYVKVLAWQTSWWSGCDREVRPMGDVTKQVVQMLEELEAILDKDKVERALALMTASKTGLCDSEMLDLLAHDPAFHSKATYVLWAPACLFWARLNKHLAPFVQWNGSGGMCTLRWRDATLQRAVRDRYLGDEGGRTGAARSLVEYFQGSWATEALPGMKGRLLSQPNKTEDSYNWRKLDELPYQVHQLEGSIREQFLLNHSWLYDKLCGSDVNQVLEDIALEESSLDAIDQDLALLRGILEKCASALLYDGRQFYSQLHKHLSDEGSAFGRRLAAVCASPPMTSLLPLPPLAGTGGVEGSEGDVLFDSVVSLGVDNFVATVSTDREEICVWRVQDARRVRTLAGVTQPFSLRPVDAHRCVVLCRRELRVIDLDRGEFRVKLKGVMNQKMPYFGLHDSNHLVALSRNRMYVNLMNLESGDCVTTFKVGEDRFLNSLLVSGDGRDGVTDSRVLVCGDETQKPFPLLVWNLSSRKLLYDLRIPHHDFVTTLSAITFEGHYVCCVAKEVDEPGPNFIVVYDLQSGTLFKKWKPGVDTVSLAISSHDACVVSGLEDARILVWDLVTGNCRCSLYGHTAPVDFLRLDQAGGALLSADSLGRDRSLRLWDLNKGCLLAVYTPERPVTCCEVTNGGRFVVLAVRGRADISTLELRGPAVIEPDSSEADVVYGRRENDGLTFDLSEPDSLDNVDKATRLKCVRHGSSALTFMPILVAFPVGCTYWLCTFKPSTVQTLVCKTCTSGIES